MQVHLSVLLHLLVDVDAEKGVKEDVGIKWLFQPDRLEVSHNFGTTDVKVVFFLVFHQLLGVFDELFQLLASEVDGLGREDLTGLCLLLFLDILFRNVSCFLLA